jgi:hypothetical protein
MDIFEQVSKILKDMETREKRNRIDRQLVEGSALAELVTRYNHAILDRQWESAHDCLINISKLVAVMLIE